MNYYISDMHIGCTNKYENRTLEHDLILKENWNKRVTNSDDVYILGDIGRTGSNKDNEYLISLLSTFRGRKHLIIGNHDNLKDQRLKQLFVEIVDYKEVSDNYNGIHHNLCLSHYPILMWNKQHKKNILLYGHTHMSKENELFQDAIKTLNSYFEEETSLGRTDCPQCLAINVGCMFPYINYTPRILKELLQK